MKNLKMALAAVVVVAAATLAFTAPKKAITTLDYSYTGSTFTMGDQSVTPITTTSNWQETVGDPSCFSTNNLCRVVATFDGTPSPAIQESDILTAVKNQYISNSNSFSDNEQFLVNINGVDVTLEVRLKSAN